MTYKDFKVRLSTGWWKVVVEPILGWCNYKELNTIIVRPSTENMDRLDTIIHEALHASKKGMSEAEVARVATDIARVVWRAGYRKVDKP